MNQKSARNLPPLIITQAVAQFTRHRHKVRGKARLSLVALYSLYSLLVRELKRYEGMRLLPLSPSPQVGFRSTYIGDINILKRDATYLEAITIFHRVPISLGWVRLVHYRLFQLARVERYYILTTVESSIEKPEEIYQETEEIRRNQGCEVITDGFLPTFERYLMLLKDPMDFFDVYSENLVNDIEQKGGVKIEHLRVWTEIRQHFLAAL